MAMVSAAALGFLLADGERRRVGLIRAMRRALLRMYDVIRYEQPALPALLRAVDMRANPQERLITSVLHACAKQIEAGGEAQLLMRFAEESARLPAFGVLSEEDRSAFESVLGELGRCPMGEQLRLIDDADERLRAREEELRAQCRKRAQLFRTLGLSAGAAAFLVLI